ncbi:MAG: hypothetical protein ACXVDN_19705, partial [Ktedonobacteraceae bacterium]
RHRFLLLFALLRNALLNASSFYPSKVPNVCPPPSENSPPVSARMESLGLLSIVIAFVIVLLWMTNFLENAEGILMVTFYYLPLLALVGGVAFFITGLLVYRTDRESR